MARQVIYELLDTKVGTLLDPRFHMSDRGQRLMGTLFAGVVAAKLLLRVFARQPPTEDYMLDPNVGMDFKVVTQKEPELADMRQLNVEMRRTFEAGYTLPIAKRLEQLRAMRRMFRESEGRILAALKEDLNRPQFEGIFYDVKVPLLEIDTAIRSLRTWAAPEYKGFNVLTFPSTQWLQKQPYGVALVIGSWNYPFCLSLVPVMGAIAAGNTVVLKPCNVSSACSRLQAELVREYMDPLVVQVVGTTLKGDRHCTAALLEQRWDKIFFTGSPAVGKVVALGAAQHLTPCTLELGGKNPTFVDKSANISMAAKRTCWARCMNAGQQCISPDVVLCHRDVADEFCEAAKGWLDTFFEGDAQTSAHFGRIVGASQFERVKGMLESHGGTMVCGGKVDAKERYVAPTVVRVGLDSPALEDETFGPILWVVAVDDMDAAINYMSGKPKPLSLYIFSGDDKVSKRICQNTSSGGVTINGTLFHCGHPDLPFGGVGSSGMGGYHGKASFDVFTHAKPVLQKGLWWDGGALSDPFFLYAPWTDLKQRVMWFLVDYAA